MFFIISDLVGKHFWETGKHLDLLHAYVAQHKNVISAIDLKFAVRGAIGCCPWPLDTLRDRPGEAGSSKKRA